MGELAGHDSAPSFPTSQSPRIYEQLHRESDEIRLFQIAGAGPDGIRCTMSTVSLSGAPRYVALSYTWGRIDSSCAIILNGERIPVRKNLWRFLSQAAKLSSIREERFWIDAICINQSDNLERTNQVGMMARIYQSALKVLAWLGPTYNGSHRAMQALSKRAANDSDTSKTWWSAGVGILGICERAYWIRLWVLQELVLAQDLVLMCGPEQISWKQLERFMQQSQSNPPLLRRGELNRAHELAMQSRAMSMMEQVRQAHGKAPLLEQMKASRHLLCSDLHDKVYGLLGIVTEGHQTISADYTMSLPALIGAVLANDPVFQQLNSCAEFLQRCRLAAEIPGMDVDALMTSSVWVTEKGKQLAPDFADVRSDFFVLQEARHLVNNDTTLIMEEIAQCPLCRKETIISLWWVDTYGPWVFSMKNGRRLVPSLPGIHLRNRQQ